MAWFGKKEDEELLPNLPEDKTLPGLPDVENHYSNYQYTAETKPTTFSPRDFGTTIKQNLDGAQRSSFDIRSSRESTNFIPEVPFTQNSVSRSNIKMKSKGSPDSVYIRLDKFNVTKEALEDMKARVIEFERTIDKIKEVKEREGKELEEWEREIQLIKARLDSIDSNLFDNVL